MFVFQVGAQTAVVQTVIRAFHTHYCNICIQEFFANKPGDSGCWKTIRRYHGDRKRGTVKHKLPSAARFYAEHFGIQGVQNFGNVINPSVPGELLPVGPHPLEQLRHQFKRNGYRPASESVWFLKEYLTWCNETGRMPKSRRITRASRALKLFFTQCSYTGPQLQASIMDGCLGLAETAKTLGASYHNDLLTKLFVAWIPIAHTQDAEVVRRAVERAEALEIPFTYTVALTCHLLF